MRACALHHEIYPPSLLLYVSPGMGCLWIISGIASLIPLAGVIVTNAGALAIADRACHATSFIYFGWVCIHPGRFRTSVRTFLLSRIEHRTAAWRRSELPRRPWACPRPAAPRRRFAEMANPHRPSGPRMQRATRRPGCMQWMPAATSFSVI